MNKAELESKNLSELHALAAEAELPKYRMLSRGELAEKLSDGSSSQGSGSGPRGPRQEGSRSGGQRGEGARSGSGRERPPRRRGRSGAGADPDRGSQRQPQARPESPPAAPEPPAAAPAASGSPSAAAQSEPSRPRRRRRRRFGRRSKEGVTLQDLLLPPEAGRQAILSAESASACTALLRGVAADLAADSNGPDPVILLIDPSPEELADWKREAPQAEIVAAGQARHASDALAQAVSRAGGGEDVMLLVDSLTRLATAYGDADSAKEFFDAGRTQGAAGGGSLTVVAALERPARG